MISCGMGLSSCGEEAQEVSMSTVQRKRRKRIMIENKTWNIENV